MGGEAVSVKIGLRSGETLTIPHVRFNYIENLLVELSNKGESIDGRFFVFDQTVVAMDAVEYIIKKGDEG